MSRNDVAQKAPAADADLTGFPTEMSDASAVRFRAHNIKNGPWYFSSKGGGRFDLAPPLGTLYFADTVSVALREHLGETIVQSQNIPEARAKQIRVSAIIDDDGVRYANLCDDRAVRWSITRELSTMNEYDVPHAWAALFEESGFDGIRYAARYSTGAGPDSWAKFGEDGPLDTGVIIDVESVEGVDACAAAGIRVLGVPGSRASLTVLGV